MVTEQFVCDLNKCKGGCCEDGDAGAPLTDEELVHLRTFIGEIRPYLTPEGLKQIDEQGLYRFDAEFGWVTPTIQGKICAYGHRDENGIIKCGIEQACLEKKNHLEETRQLPPVPCKSYQKQAEEPGIPELRTPGNALPACL